MWNEKTRERHKSLKKVLKRYPSDMTDEEWAFIEPLLPVYYKRGRPRQIDLREVINALR